MDLRTLQYFIAISEAGSMNKAAQSLFVSQPAISQSIARLERELDTELFRRSRNNTLELTPAGVRFHEFCRDTLALWSRTSAEIKAIRDSSSPKLTVGSSSIYLQSWVALMANLKDSGHEDLDFIFDTADALKEKLLSGAIQMILGAYDEEHPALEYVKTQERELFLCVGIGHPLAKYSYLQPGNEGLRVPIEIAAGEEFVLLSPATVIRHQTDRYFREHDFRPLATSTVRRSDEVLIKLVTSHSVGFVSRAVDGQSLIAPLALDPPILYRTGAIYQKNYKLPEVLKTLIGHFRNSYSPADYFPECPYEKRDGI